MDVLNIHMNLFLRDRKVKINKYLFAWPSKWYIEADYLGTLWGGKVMKFESE